MSLDYTGEHGGQLAMAFAAGWGACMAACTALGAFLWKILGKAKDEQIASLLKTIEKNEDRCAETIDVLTTRVVQLETMLWMHGPQQLRAQMQAVVSEQHQEMRQALLDIVDERESKR